MSSNRSDNPRRGIWLVALVASTFLALVAWDQLHVRSRGRQAPTPPAATAGLAESPAPARAITVTPAPAPRHRPEAPRSSKPAGDMDPEELEEGQHAI